MRSSVKTDHISGRRLAPRGLHEYGVVLAMAVLPFAWLMPQHYLPWLTSQQDAVTLLLLMASGIALVRSPSACPVPWALAIASSLVTILAQYASGHIRFHGDAVMAALYIGAFGCALVIGCSLARTPVTVGGWSAIDLLSLGILISAVLSVAVALMQWTVTSEIPIPSAAHLLGDRPYANLAQANHFSTVAFLGIAAASWLCESRRLRLMVWTCVVSLLLMGMALSGSRTGWLQMGTLIVVLALMRLRGTTSTLKLQHGLILLVGFAACWLLIPVLNDQLQLSSGARAVVESTRPEARWPLWRAALDAILERPWAGYGWQQIPSAMFEVALQHPSLRHYFEYSHNLLFDLVLWNGLPIAGILVVLSGLALARQARAATAPRSGAAPWLLIGVLAVLAHSMVEFPYAYAYLLVPLGLCIGALHGIAPANAEWQLDSKIRAPILITLLAALLLVISDYLRAEVDYRAVRLEARFGKREPAAAMPDLRVLDQLEAYLQFIRTQARRNMSPQEIETFADVARRYGHPPVLLRLALAYGLNGRKREATDSLARICALHEHARCDEAREAWRSAQQLYPELADIPSP